MWEDRGLHSLPPVGAVVIFNVRSLAGRYCRSLLRAAIVIIGLHFQQCDGCCWPYLAMAMLAEYFCFVWHLKLSSTSLLTHLLKKRSQFVAKIPEVLFSWAGTTKLLGNTFEYHQNGSVSEVQPHAIEPPTVSDYFWYHLTLPSLPTLNITYARYNSYLHITTKINRLITVHTPRCIPRSLLLAATVLIAPHRSIGK